MEARDAFGKGEEGILAWQPDWQLSWMDELAVKADHSE